MLTPQTEDPKNINIADDIKSGLVPIIPLKDVVIFPNMVVPLFIGRQKSITALESAEATNSTVILLSQKNPDDNEATPTNLHQIGTLAKILQTLKLPDGTIKVLIEGKTRAKATEIKSYKGYLAAVTEIISTQFDINNIELEALKREIIGQFHVFSKLHQNQKIPDEIVSLISKMDNVEQLTDVITTHVVLDMDIKQEMLETNSLKKRMNYLLRELNREIEILNVEKRIQGRVKQAIEKNQKEYYLHEQAKAIQQELGEDEELSDNDRLAQQIKKAKMSVEAETKAVSELKKLRASPPMNSETSMIKNYIEHLIELPWSKKTKINHDLAKAQKVLDRDHYGLEKIKERIIEFLAVQKRVENNKAPILCFVGPPGVGKTSLGESIARATGRKYIRVALGGLHDESEIRGHRRTYIGAMPGKIMQNIAKVGVKNPLFLLDEIDKIGSDHRGDPASALLEVLDPEQNKAFVDNYIETSFDLSNVMFVATANSLNIPEALLDRMEIIRLSGYTEQEKMKIAEHYLIPKQMKNNGLKSSEFDIKDEVITEIIRHYTAEAGVRNLDRQINKICRKIVTALDLKKIQTKKSIIKKNNLHDFLGVEQYDFGVKSIDNRIGRVTGLAWTEVGGEILTIEAVAVPGKGLTIHTGHLGDVMKESIQAAISLVRSRAPLIGIDNKFHENKDLHVHVPEGAIPKDGPSAGIAMVTAIASSLNHIPVKSDVAMTGEVTLYGDVLPIGGLKEKLLAALRAGITTVIIPHKNVKDLEEMPAEIKEALKIIPVKTVNEVLAIALERTPVPIPEIAIEPTPTPSSIPPLPSAKKPSRMITA